MMHSKYGIQARFTASGSAELWGGRCIGVLWGLVNMP